MLNLRSIAARRLAKNSPTDYFYTASQCRSLCFSIYYKIPKQVRDDDNYLYVCIRISGTRTIFIGKSRSKISADKAA